MQAELIMDGNDDDLVTPEQLKAEAEKRLRKKPKKPSVSMRRQRKSRRGRK